MKNYQTSDYAVNKNAEGIVYRFADQTVEVTLADYLRENPDKTAADFAELKALSDEDYYATDRSDYRQTWKNVPLETLSGRKGKSADSRRKEAGSKPKDELPSSPSAEDEVVGQSEQAEAYAKRQSLAALALDKLTEIQRRRYVMYHVKGISMRQIADYEGVQHSKIQNSLNAAEKKIKKFLSGGKK